MNIYVDNGDKLFSGVNDTGDKFFGGVSDTGDQRVLSILACLHLKKKNKQNINLRCKVHSTKLLTKYFKKLYLKIFLFICKYLREFCKKI